MYKFQNARIFLDKFEVILHSPDNIAPVGFLHPLAFHLQHKMELLSSGSCDIGSGKVGYVCEVQGDSTPDHMVQSLSACSQLGNCTTKNLNLCISRSSRDMFSIGCWIQNVSKTLDG